MNVALRGSSPATIACGILLLSRARSFGQPIRVEIVGDPDDIGVVSGPAVLHSAPLAGCGVGRELGHGSVVVIPGPSTEPLAVSLSPDGRSDWFLVDRTGAGVHPATQTLVRMRRERRPSARQHARQFFAALEALGVAAEPAVIDLLFGAPVPPLNRVAVALRAGRGISGRKGSPVTQLLEGEMTDAPPTLASAVARLPGGLREEVTQWLAQAERFAAEDGDRAALEALEEIGAHFAMLPPRGILPPLAPSADAVAYQLGRALGATQGNPQAQATLLETYRFLGGRFTDRADWPLDLSADPPPPDRLGRWAWFCSQVASAAEKVDRVWRDLVDPPM
ncbi:MAG: hypothetical protein ACOZNI_26715 [Myxococcota bacterium]